jgi:transposase InsO family protein
VGQVTRECVLLHGDFIGEWSESATALEPVIKEALSPRINQKGVRAAGTLRSRIRRKRLARNYASLRAPTAAGQEWAIDFANGVTASGRRLRGFSVIDAFTRECLALGADTSAPSRGVTRVLQRILDERGALGFLRSDNGRRRRVFGTIWPGVWSEVSPPFTSNREGPPKTGMWKSFLGDSVMNA